jgi:hypothetical protein
MDGRSGPDEAGDDMNEEFPAAGSYHAPRKRGIQPSLTFSDYWIVRLRRR